MMVRNTFDDDPDGWRVIALSVTPEHLPRLHTLLTSRELAIAEKSLAAQEKLVTIQEKLATTQEKLATTQEKLLTTQKHLLKVEEKSLAILEQLLEKQNTLEQLLTDALFGPGSIGEALAKADFLSNRFSQSTRATVRGENASDVAVATV